MEKRIILNRIQCRLCDDIVESNHRHHFNVCKCGASAADGGTEYLGRMGSFYKEMSIYSDAPFEVIRQYLKWGKRYDKNLEPLPEIQWVPLMDLEDSHLDALTDYKPASEFYRLNFILEKLYRAELEY